MGHSGVHHLRFFPNGDRNIPPVIVAVALACVAISVIFILHPHLGIRDVDGYAYIMGARSLHEGNGYRSLTGEAFNHWPPGYSLLLSLFPDTILAATILNYLSFGAVIGLLYYLLCQSDWSWQAATGCSIAFASGFFRLLANAAHADIFAYALFFAGICVATQRRQLRTLPSLIWALIIPRAVQRSLPNLMEKMDLRPPSAAA